MLKLVLDTLDGLPDIIKAEYKQGGDGKFHLQSEEDSAAKAKLDEFRENNIKLMKERDELTKKLDSLGDPAEIEKMKKKIQALDDKQLLEAGKLDELVLQRTERMRLDYDNQIKELKKALEERDVKLTSTNQRLSEVLIDGEITRAINSVGVPKKEAFRDILARGRETWKLEDGKPVPKEGDRLLFGKDGKEALTFEEWAQAMLITAPFLFEPSGGGGAGGGKAGQGGFKGTGDIKTLPPTERLKAIHQMERK